MALLHNSFFIDSIYHKGGGKGYDPGVYERGGGDDKVGVGSDLSPDIYIDMSYISVVFNP